MIAVRLPQEIEERLSSLAQRTGRTKTFYVREAVLTHLEDMEDYFLAAEAYAEHKASGKAAISHEELVEKHGLEN